MIGEIKMERIALMYRKIRNWWFERTKDGVEQVSWLTPTERTWAIFESEDRPGASIEMLVHVWEVTKETERGCTLFHVKGLVHPEGPCIKLVNNKFVPDLSRPTIPNLFPVHDMKDNGLLFRRYHVD